jgi:hypothetical protein
MKSKEPYTIDSFWPEASTMLDKHFAHRRALRRLRILGFGGCALLLIVLALVFGSTDSFIPSQQKQAKNASKSESTKGARIERSADANRHSFKPSIAKSGSSTSQNRYEVASKIQTSDSEQGKATNRNMPITTYRDKSTYQGNHIAYSSTQKTLDEKGFSDSEKFSIVNSDETERVDFPALKNEHSEKNPTANDNENTTNSSVVEIVHAEGMVQNETENSLVKDASNSKNNSLTEQASNTPPAGIIPELGEVKKASWEWALVPSVGMFNSVKYLKSNTNTSAYVTRRTQEEENSFRETFRMGLELSKERLTFQSGIYYSVYGERTAYTNWLMRTMPEIELYNQVVYDTNLTLVSYLDMGNFYEISVASIDSSVQTFADTTLVTIQSTVDALPFHVQNRISYIEIPLGLRYTAYRNALLDVGISAGGSLGFLWRSRGFVVNSELNEFVPLDASAGIQKLIGTVRIAADLRYRLTENLSLGIRPEWNSTLGAVLRQNSIQQNYRNWGMLFELKRII